MDEADRLGRQPLGMEHVRHRELARADRTEARKLEQMSFAARIGEELAPLPRRDDRRPVRLRRVQQRPPSAAGYLAQRPVEWANQRFRP